MSRIWPGWAPSPRKKGLGSPLVTVTVWQLLAGTSCGVRLERDVAGVDVEVVLFDVDVKGDVLVLQVGQHRLSQVLKHTQMLKRLGDLLLQLLLDALQQLFLLSNHRKPQTSRHRSTGDWFLMPSNNSFSCQTTSNLKPPDKPVTQVCLMAATARHRSGMGGQDIHNKLSHYTLLPPQTNLLVHNCYTFNWLDLPRRTDGDHWVKCRLSSSH